MRTNGRLFVLLTVFYFAVMTAYIIWHYATYETFEPIGTAALAMLAMMSAFIAFYLLKVHKSQGLVPEDSLEANIEDGDAEVGFFSPWSWWPFAIGAGSALAFASLAIGWWLFFIALPLALIALIGFVFEYSRGQHAH